MENGGEDFLDYSMLIKVSWCAITLLCSILWLFMKYSGMNEVASLEERVGVHWSDYQKSLFISTFRFRWGIIIDFKKRKCSTAGFRDARLKYAGTSTWATGAFYCDWLWTWVTKISYTKPSKSVEERCQRKPKAQRVPSSTKSDKSSSINQRATIYSKRSLPIRLLAYWLLSQLNQNYCINENLVL